MSHPIDPAEMMARASALIEQAQEQSAEISGFFDSRRREALRLLQELQDPAQVSRQMALQVGRQLEEARSSWPPNAVGEEIDPSVRMARRLKSRRTLV